MNLEPLRSKGDVEVGEWVVAIDKYGGHLIPGKLYQVKGKKVSSYGNDILFIDTPSIKLLSAYPYRFAKQLKVKTIEELL